MNDARLESKVHARPRPLLRGQWMVLCAAMAFALLAPLAASAQTPTTVESILCEVLGMLEGQVGEAIATLAIIAVGFLAFLGRMEKKIAAYIAVGIALLMGAASVMAMLDGNDGQCIFVAPNIPDFACVEGAVVPQGANMFAVGGVNDNDNTDQDSGGAPAAGDNACSDPNMGIFARTLCIFKSTVGEVMSAMFCALEYNLEAPLGTVLTFAVILFGLAIMTGIAQLNIKEAAWVALKLSLVWVFATHAEYAIAIAYRMFMGAAEEGADIVLSALADPGGNAPSLTAPDTIITNLLGFSSGKGTSLSAQVQQVVQACAPTLFVMLGLTLAFLPIVFTFIFMMTLQYIALYARAMLGYLTAIVLIAFLFILSPIFISFALFKITRPLFEQWISYLFSFSIQIIVIFGFLALLGLVLAPIGDFFTHLLNLMRNYDSVVNANNWDIPNKMCSICQYQFTNDGPGGLQEVECTNQAPNGQADLQAGYLPSADGTVNVIPLTNLLTHQDFVIFVVSRVIALWLLAKIMESFLKGAPEFARQLGGSPVAASLGGETAIETPGQGNIQYLWMDSFQAGMQGLRNGMTGGSALDPTNTLPRRLAAGIKGYATGFLYGSSDETTSDAAQIQEQQTQADQRVAAAKKELDGVESKVDKSYREMQDALNELNSANPADRADALERLRKAHDAYVTAVGNEPVALERLTAANNARSALNPTPTLGGILTGEKTYGSTTVKGLSTRQDGDVAQRAVAALKRERAAGDATAQNVSDMNQTATNMINNINRQVEVSSILLPAEKVTEVEAALAKARTELKAAKTQQDYQQVIDQLNAVNKELPKRDPAAAAAVPAAAAAASVPAAAPAAVPAAAPSVSATGPAAVAAASLPAVAIPAAAALAVPAATGPATADVPAATPAATSASARVPLTPTVPEPIPPGMNKLSAQIVQQYLNQTQLELPMREMTMSEDDKKAARAQLDQLKTELANAKTNADLDRITDEMNAFNKSVGIDLDLE